MTTYPINKKKVVSKVVEFLIAIGLKPNKEQIEKIDEQLVMKQTRKGYRYFRTDVEYTDDMDLPNQAIVLLSGLSAEPVYTRQWVKNLKGVLNSRQDHGKVVNYFKRRLEKLNLIGRTK